ncbi:MAG: D-alanyl-D-alanine carboxypeptidase [Clostridium sp.]|nr:D-alanyl-D-alanine carboxypeptidase [Clostridium sp.]
MFLALSCVIIRQGEIRVAQKDTDEMYTYQLTLREGALIPDDSEEQEWINTAADITALSKLNAKYALLMDATNRRVLFEKSGYEQAPMASTTKIMTLLVTLENANLDDIVTVSAYAASMPDVQLNIRKDEQYRLGDLVYSLMLESHNDTAVAIAEHVGGSVEGFAAMMNEKAQELGAYNTSFVTPNGLDAENHYTTAYDLALISSYAIQNETFLQIVQTPSYSFHEQTTGRAFTVNNKDRFLTSYEGAIGIKTGFTGNAGYCFVGAVDRDGKRLVSVVLACGWPPHKTYKWKDTAGLMNYGISQYNLKEVLPSGITFQQIPVEDSIEGGSITPYNQEVVALLLREDENVNFDVKLPVTLSAPVEQGQTIGEVTITVNGEVYKIVPLYSMEQRTKITYEYILKRILFKFFGGYSLAEG